MFFFNNNKTSKQYAEGGIVKAKFYNKDLQSDIEKIKGYDDVNITKSKDENLESQPYIIDVNDNSYFYQNEKQRDADYSKIHNMFRKYAEGGIVGDYQIELENWFARVHEDDYENGEGDQVNSFADDVNKTFKTAKQLFDYINDKIIYKDIDAANYFAIEDGRITTSLLVDSENIPASESQIEIWKKGELKLYTANYDFYIRLVSRKTPTTDDLANILGVEK